MAVEKRDRACNPDAQTADGQRQRAARELLARDYNYLFHLSESASRLLDTHRAALAAATTGFAEQYYNYLFDNPDIADVLYAYERGGGDVGQFVRTELQNLLNSVTSVDLRKRVDALLASGRLHLEHRFRPAWVIGAYDLFIEYLRGLLPDLAMTNAERRELEALLVRMLLHDLGLTLEGYWSAAGDELSGALAHETRRRSQVEEMLAGIPHYLWSVDIRANRIRYANYSLRVLYDRDMDAPFPCFADTHGEDTELLLSVWQDAVNGNSRQVELRMSLGGGEQHWYRIALYPADGSQGRPSVVHCVLEDINHQVAERKQLQQLSTTDYLTGLPNRVTMTNSFSFTVNSE